VTWQVACLALFGLVLTAGFGWYERTRPSARVLALVASLAALAVVGRLAFAAIPNVKPTTDIVLFAGYALGPIPGFVVGAVTAVASNVFLGQGPWTAWQMVAWGAVGVGGALLARLAGRREIPRLPLALACALAGLAFGAFMDVYQWTLAARQDLDTYLAVSASSLPYNIAHAVGNFVFCLLVGPPFLRALRRYRRRSQVRWERPAPVVAAAVAALMVAGTLVAAPTADARTASGKAIRYLARTQNRDGGFGGAKGQSSNQLFTGWAALGLAAAKRNPRDVHRHRGRSAATFIRRHSSSITDLGELERTVLVLKAAGLSTHSFGGRNPVAEIRSRRRSNGSFAGYVSYTAFGILALRAGGEPVGSGSPAWLGRAQNSDGGFGVAPHVSSDTDMTGAVLQALAASGHSGGPTASAAVSFLRSHQNGDGGFGQAPGRSSNSQSTAYAVQGLAAVHSSSEVVRRAVGYLVSMQRRNGSVRYSSFSTQTPVWVTAQALAAMRRRPFPLPTAPRAPRHHHSSHASAAGAGGATRADGAKGKRRERSSPSSAGEPQRGGVHGLAPGAASGAKAPLRLDRGDEGDGPSPWLFAVGGVGALIIAGLVRWQLRRRRRAPAG
jgi:prenyltransferase beta subunit/uncharacterized membrane protein